MRLTDLEPRWLLKDGRRIGFIFRNPVRGHKGWWSSMFPYPTPAREEQEALIEAELGEDALYQTCNPAGVWKCTPEMATADFATLTIQPSIDGGPNLWHGHITNGEIVGGL